MKKISLLVIFTMFFIHSAICQQYDKSEFKEYEPGFYQNSILRDVNAVNDNLNKKEPYKRFQMVQDITRIPLKVTDYTSFWSFPPVSQGNSNTCWCFSTISFLESEIKRMYNREVRLSEIYIVYCEYIEKAREFVRQRGNSAFAEGSESNAVTRMMKIYGAMPQSVYTGLLHNRKYHTHDAMFEEMKSFLDHVKQTSEWNEEWVIATIKNIMNHHLGEPPAKFMADGIEFTPLTYLTQNLKLNPDDYVEILSYKQEPYWQKVEYKVPDNWWHSKEYYNVPLDDFMAIVKNGIQKGFTMSIGGDVSEAGLLKSTQAAMIPSFDIPSEFINDDARQFRFSNQTTTDDHGMHLTGYCIRDGKWWFLIKDSSSGSRNNNQQAPEFGYYFFSEDYVKLKMMDFTIHKDAVKDILARFGK